jgi:Leucine-rich repeat (LRR) protein
VESITPIVDQQSALPGLKHLSLSSNLLISWASIDELSRWCPNLETLSLNGNPLVEGTESAIAIDAV